MGTGARKRLAVMGGTLAAALLATGLGLYATDSGPFRESYCWGAWEENSGPPFLDDKKLDEPGSRRKSSETATPSAGHPRGSCWVEVTSGDGDDTTQDAVRFSEKVTVQVGPLPAAKTGRHDWLAQHFHGSAAPLPDGLDGMVGRHRAMLVLPEECDADGTPSVVTLRGESWGDGSAGRKAMPFGIGTYSDTTRLLLDVANTTMRHVGCAPEEPLSTSSPFVTLAEDSESLGDPLCRIPGVRFDLGDRNSTVRYQEQVGAVTDRLQTCSLVWSSTPAGEGEPVAQYVMTSSPRMTALFGGLPEGERHGLVRATCDGRETVFYGHVRGAAAVDLAAVKRSFKNFVASVGNRIGCRTEGTA
ncbi:hypothetical protein IGX29_10310 [Streptomyces sp. H28]|nr:hypothetical protein [Streptomyces sp. H28]